MRIQDLSIHLRLTRLRPTGQRLRQLVAAFAGWGYRSLYLDWRDSFPWTFDERFHGENPYREELVAGIYAEARGQGLAVNTVFPGPTELGFVARTPGYGHLFQTVDGLLLLPPTSRPARKFLDDLVDDFLALLPDPGQVLLDWPEAGFSAEAARCWTAPFRDRGVSLIGRYYSPGRARTQTIESCLSFCDEIILPIDSRADCKGSVGDRVIWEASVLSPDDRKTVEALIRTSMREVGVGKSTGADPLLLAFQPGVRRGSADVTGRHAGLLRGSIELSLNEARSLAELSRGVDGDFASEIPTWPGGDVVETERLALGVDDLQRTIDEGWRSIRAIREGCVSHAGRLEPGTREESLDLTLLEASRNEAARLSAELLDLLSPAIEPERVRRELASVVVPLDEEYFLLLSRLAAADRLAADDYPA